MAKLRATYSKHHREDAQGHIHLEKKGPCTIQLIGAASMSQEELDFFGEKIAEALSKIEKEKMPVFENRI